MKSTVSLFRAIRLNNLIRRNASNETSSSMNFETAKSRLESSSIEVDNETKLKLYGLYNKVLDTVAGYFDIAWVDVNIDKINQELSDFQAACRKLPKGLREFPAYHALKKSIDDFSECKFIFS